MAPEVPVMVMVVLPTAAVLAAVKTTLVLPVVGFAAKAAVTPAGSPETARLTIPVKPYWLDTDTVEVAVLPCPTVTELDKIVNVGEPMVSEVVVVTEVPPEVPVMVIVFVPTGAVAFAVKVTVEEPFVAGLGENEAVTPLGRPDTDRLTAPMNP
jgi:hypothetical protein